MNIRETNGINMVYTATGVLLPMTPHIKLGLDAVLVAVYGGYKVYKLVSKNRHTDS